MKEILLKDGDIIMIKEGDNVYADIPEHFVYSNKRGCFDLTHSEAVVGGEFDYLQGKYVVTKTSFEGGGSCHNDTYPDGHRVYCVNADHKHLKIDFYQTGFFTAMITNREPIGRAELNWTIN